VNVKRKGAVIIVSVLFIAFALISISAILTSTYLNGFQLESTEFRGTVSHLSASSHGAVVMGLADITKSMDQRMKTESPSDYYHTSAIELTDMEVDRAYSILTEYQNNARLSYPNMGLLINFENPVFLCDWTDVVGKRGYSMARSNISVSLSSVGFSGLENYSQIETNATIGDLVDTDGRMTEFMMQVVSEGDNPIDNLSRGLVRIYYANYTTNSDISWTEYSVNSLQYVNSEYHVTSGSDYDTINVNIANLTAAITTLPDANFTSVTEKTLLLSTLSTIDSKYDSYHDGDRSQAWLNDAWVLMCEVRTKVNHSSSGCIINAGIDTTGLLGVVDVTLRQLRPIVRIVVTDFRGITVSACGELGSGAIRPMIIYEKAVLGGSSYTLTATIDNHLSDNDNIVQVEYYVSQSASSIPGGAVARAMTAVDGVLDEPVEATRATVSLTYLYSGTNYLWIHAKDSRGHWSEYVKVKLPGYIHLQPIDGVGNAYIIMTGHTSGSGSGAKYWVTAQVRVVDDSGIPVSGATVKGTWSGSYVSTDTKSTSGTGYCEFETTHKKYSDWPTVGGYKTFTISITSVSKAGYTWTDPTPSDTLRLTASKTWI
jgi:hypothetical protein